METLMARLVKSLLIVLVSALFCSAASAETPLKPRTVRRPAFEVIGIASRTSFQKESSDSGMLPQMWKRFYKESLIDQIPSKANDEIVSCYTDFSGDATGEYTAVLGAVVKPGSKAPDGMLAVQVPAGKYLEFTTEQGSLGETVPKLWNQITEYFKRPGAPKRTFKTDYEVYEAAIDPAHASGKIYVGVK